jgi:hypothetical protein
MVLGMLFDPVATKFDPMKPAPPVTSRRRRRIVPGILAEAPEPFAALVRADMHHRGALDGPGTRGHRCRPPDGPSRRWSPRPPVSSSPASSPVPAGPPWRTGCGARRPGPAARRHRRAGHTGVPRARRRTSSRTGGPPAAPAPPASSRQVPPASGGPGQATLSPMPTTTAPDPSAPGSRPGGGPRELRLGQHPGQLCPADQQVVGPFEHRPTPATSRQASAAARATAAAHRCSSAGRRSGRNRTDTSRICPGGASQRRSSRPRPAVWCSATATALGGPRPGPPRR